MFSRYKNRIFGIIIPSKESACLTSGRLHIVANTRALNSLDAPPHAPQSSDEAYGLLVL